MIYSFECSNGSPIPSVNTVTGKYQFLCSLDGETSSGGILSMVPVVAITGQTPSITSADIAVLLSAALGIFALAWGFKSIGKLLFKDA